MNDRQLIADLLSALEYHTEQTRPIQFSKVAIEAAREYLRKPAQQPAQQEPVAWKYKVDPAFDGERWHDRYDLTESKTLALWKDKDAQPLYTSPPNVPPARASKPWVGLTSEEKKEIERLSIYVEGAIRHTEAKLREKNHG